MTTAEHLISPDGKWYWDGADQEWKPKHPTTTSSTPAPKPEPETKPEKGLSSFAGEVRSQDLAYGQTVLVWARWILIGTGLMLSFWSPTDLTTLQVQLAAIIALAFGNFYLHVQLLRVTVAKEIDAELERIKKQSEGAGSASSTGSAREAQPKQ